MKIRELIELLKTFDPELDVAYAIHSEQCLLEPEDIDVVELCIPRPDGWIQDARPDKPTQTYVRFP